MVKDKSFRIAISNTLTYSLLLSVPTVMISLILAMGLNRVIYLKSTLRALYLLPHLFSWVVIGLI